MKLEAALSTPRLSKYRDWLSGDNSRVVALYALNLAVSESLYTSQHILEITLRNAINDRMQRLHGAGWITDPQIIQNTFQQQKVIEAIRKVRPPVENGSIVAELTFGFWTALFGRRNAQLWGQQLKPIFGPSRPLQRKEVAKRLDRVRNLRNRIAHHEPIIQYDLLSEYENIITLIGWLSTDALSLCEKQSRFFDVHPTQPILINGLVNPEIEL